MTINISPDPRLQFFGNDGKFLVGGKLYTYAAGTTTLLATYTDLNGTTPNTNPIILDSRGEASVWLGKARYKFVLKDANDVEIWTQDNLIMSPGADGSGAYGTWDIDISGNAATATIADSVVEGGAVNKIIAGTNITISPSTGVGNVTINATSSATVTSVNATGLYGFTVTGGPITTSGTLTVTPPAPSTSGNVLTSNGTAWVSAVLPFSMNTNAVGSYGFCFSHTTAYDYGDSAAGGSITPCSASGYGSTTATLSGTWRCMGYAFASGGTSGATLFVRIA